MQSQLLQSKACPECGDTFNTERMLNMHHRVQHERLPSFLCPHCNGPYGRVTELNAHILNDHAGEKRSRKCEECVCTFASLFQLRQHIQTAHRREVLKCSHCDYVSVYQGLLKRHKEVEHDVKEEMVERDHDAQDKRSGPSYEEVKKRTIGHIVVPRDV